MATVSERTSILRNTVALLAGQGRLGRNHGQEKRGVGRQDTDGLETEDHGVCEEQEEAVEERWELRETEGGIASKKRFRIGRALDLLL